MAILITVLALFALTALFIWLGSKLEDQFAKQRNRDKELFDLEQQLGIPSSMRWHNSKPDIHEEIQNTLAERQRIIDELNK
jgi:predicted PurR-regulated permease PerM